MVTLVEEIFSHRLGRDVHAGEIVVADVDCAMAHDVTGPVRIQVSVPLGVTAPGGPVTVAV